MVKPAREKAALLLRGGYSTGSFSAETSAPAVRDTWELTADQVSLGGTWDRLLDEALVDVHDRLGLPRVAHLRADLHALLFYGPDQFFAPHQDSEKDDEMVATLVVSLGCGCDLCDTLQGFLADRDATKLDWPLRADRRQHIHQRIDAGEPVVSHRTIRKGSPYTLRLIETGDLHEREEEQRRQATADLAWLRRPE